MDGFVKLRLTIFVAKSVNNNETLFFDSIIMRISCQEANLIMHASHHWPFSVVLFLLFFFVSSKVIVREEYTSLMIHNPKYAKCRYSCTTGVILFREHKITKQKDHRASMEKKNVDQSSQDASQLHQICCSSCPVRNVKLFD